MFIISSTAGFIIQVLIIILIIILILVRGQRLTWTEFFAILIVLTTVLAHVTIGWAKRRNNIEHFSTWTEIGSLPSYLNSSFMPRLNELVMYMTEGPSDKEATGDDNGSTQVIISEDYILSKQDWFKDIIDQNNKLTVDEFAFGDQLEAGARALGYIEFYYPEAFQSMSEKYKNPIVAS